MTAWKESYSLDGIGFVLQTCTYEYGHCTNCYYWYRNISKLLLWVRDYKYVARICKEIMWVAITGYILLLSEKNAGMLLCLRIKNQTHCLYC